MTTVGLLLILIHVGTTTQIQGDTAVSSAAEQQRYERSYRLEQLRLLISVLGFGGTVAALGFGARQYWRAEKWKRAEFLAGEMKEFFDDRRVQNVLTMSDWGVRRINLNVVDRPADAELTLVTRALQCEALTPHVLQASGEGSDRAVDQADQPHFGPRIFTPQHAAIRDSYDVFLDGLERFGSYMATGLVSAEDLRPYIGYWVDDIAAPTQDPADALWTCCFIVYVDFYRYPNVQRLFRAFGHDIDPRGPLFAELCQSASDSTLRRQLTELIRTPVM